MKRIFLLFTYVLLCVFSACSESKTTTKKEYAMLQKQDARVFDFATKTVTLNDGNKMPLYGLGTYSLKGEVCVKVVKAAFACGVRLIDTAYFYGNEAEIDKAIRESLVPREEIFIIIKLYPSQFGNAEKAIDEVLEKLGTPYIDMMLLHHPGASDVKAYHAMEKAVADGKIRSLGLSNWYEKELEVFLPKCKIAPVLVQNEIHPFYQERDVVPFIQSLGIVAQGWYPFGGRGYTKPILTNETLSKIVLAHKKSVAQVILRWNLQRGVVVILGSSNSTHIKENTEIFDFKLTASEMQDIEKLNRNEKHDWY